jgi:hypothetical protein
MKRPALLLFGIIAIGLSSMRGVAAAETKSCIDLGSMRNTHAVDNHTVVVTLRGNHYQKIALANDCTGLKIQDGFSYATSIAQLCPGDIITVLGGGGERCGIAAITSLSATEAKSLLARH